MKTRTLSRVKSTVKGLVTTSPLSVGQEKVSHEAQLGSDGQGSLRVHQCQCLELILMKHNLQFQCLLGKC